MRSIFRGLKKSAGIYFLVLIPVLVVLNVKLIPAFGYSGAFNNITAITAVSEDLKDGTVSIYTKGDPSYREYLFRSSGRNYLILELNRSILYARGNRLLNPFRGIYSISYSQFSAGHPYSVHIVFKEAYLKRLNVRKITLGGGKYRLIVYLSSYSRLSRYGGSLPVKSTGFKVFIDAGHGGGDPGGIGPMGLPEDFVNLSVGLKLKKFLESKGITAYIDRTANRDLSLRQRVLEANKSGANLFIGLYCNAQVVPYLYGTTAYYYNNYSFNFANFLNHYISLHLNLKYDGILKDDLYVLRFTKMPSVVVEYAYISNPAEEKMLASSTFRSLLAAVIGNAIYKYFIAERR